MSDSTTLERFTSKYEVVESGCWEWTAFRLPSGYGRIWDANLHKATGAHRVAYELFNGPIPDGHLVRHSCDNPPCVNPDHLLTGTPADNMQDALDRRRFPTGERSYQVKLTREQVAQARERRADGASITNMAKEFGVDSTTLSNAIAGRSWKHDSSLAQAVPPRPNKTHRKLSDDEKAQAIHLRQTTTLLVSEIAARFGCSPSSMGNLLQSVRKRAPKLTDAQIASMRAEYQTVHNYAEMARRYGITKVYARHLILGLTQTGSP